MSPPGPTDAPSTWLGCPQHREQRPGLRLPRKATPAPFSTPDAGRVSGHSTPLPLPRVLCRPSRLIAFTFPKAVSSRGQRLGVLHPSCPALGLALYGLPSSTEFMGVCVCTSLTRTDGLEEKLTCFFILTLTCVSPAAAQIPVLRD